MLIEKSLLIDINLEKDDCIDEEMAKRSKLDYIKNCISMSR